MLFPWCCVILCFIVDKLVFSTVTVEVWRKMNIIKCLISKIMNMCFSMKMLEMVSFSRPLSGFLCPVGTTRWHVASLKGWRRTSVWPWRDRCHAAGRTCTLSSTASVSTRRSSSSSPCPDLWPLQLWHLDIWHLAHGSNVHSETLCSEDHRRLPSDLTIELLTPLWPNNNN